MFVTKRDGRREPVHFDKISARIRNLCEMEPKLDAVDPVEVAQNVIRGLRKGMSTEELDRLTAETLAYRVIQHPDFGTLAARIEISNLHKKTTGDIVRVAEMLHEAVSERTGQASPLVSDEFRCFVSEHGDALRGMIDYTRDFMVDYFGIKTLQRAYLFDINKNIVERPQDMWMRVAVELNMRRDGEVDDELRMLRLKETYDLLSQGFYTHATPTLFGAGTPRPQMSSCFLLTMKEDSIAGIFDTLKQCALISKHAGGIGLSIHDVRSTGSHIRGTNGYSNGIVPMLRIFNDTACYVDQGGGKRNGSFAMYIEPWHADIQSFLELKKNHGKEETRARDLFYALWIPDLFMKRVESGGKWSLLCPDECPGLSDVYGDEFEALYTRYEREGKARKTVDAVQLWQQIITAQVETGTPYMLYKDHVNAKNNQSNLGVIRSSNLCAEIVEYSSKDEIAVCNLASINLSKFVTVDGRDVDVGDGARGDSDYLRLYDFAALQRTVRTAVRNLNTVIDHNFYPVDETRVSNMRHRPIGLGVQGLADTFAMMNLPFDSTAAMALNRAIFEHMYFAALEMSTELAAEFGPYETFRGSPASEGRLQVDMWRERGDWDPSKTPLTISESRWDELRAMVKEQGLRNSLLIALMPTASTSQILVNNECFEPFTNNLYSRRTLAGEFIIPNKHLQRDLLRRGLWTDSVIHKIMAASGSVQEIEEIPSDVKKVYRTVWEISQRSVLQMAAERGPFVDQTQSMNVFMATPTAAKLSSMHFYGWRKGLKTGMYYLRTRPAAMPIQFTLDERKLTSDTPTPASAPSEPPACESCSA